MKGIPFAGYIICVLEKGKRCIKAVRLFRYYYSYTYIHLDWRRDIICLSIPIISFFNFKGSHCSCRLRSVKKAVLAEYCICCVNDIY